MRRSKAWCSRCSSPWWPGSPSACRRPYDARSGGSRASSTLAGLPALPVPIPASIAPPIVPSIAPPIVPTIALPIVPTIAPPIVPAIAASTAGTSSPAQSATPFAGGVRGLALGFLAIWLAGVIASLLLHLRHARHLQGVWRRATPLESDRVRRWLRDWMGDDARRVELRGSAEVGAPLIMLARKGAHRRAVGRPRSGPRAPAHGARPRGESRATR
jgi:hypothetical protein